jgi:3-isopropylmalate/(R)-2-methylmalate dehydratase large subunit
MRARYFFLVGTATGRSERHEKEEAMTPPNKTLYDKLWDAHVVHSEAGGTDLVYIDRHLIHEVTSAQPFDGLRAMSRPMWGKTAHVAVVDHNLSTRERGEEIADPLSRAQVEALTRNAREFGVPLIPIHDARQGIVHVIGPEQGLTLPGTTVVCGDSHTSTHGAFAALAFGIGVSEVEMVLATQCIWAQRSKSMAVRLTGRLQAGVYPKDVALYLIGQIGIGGATGHAIEFSGPAVAAMSMEGRMTLCNMAIEAGARVGLVAVDQVTIDYLKGRPNAPKGAAFEQACAQWRQLVSDPGATFDEVVQIDVSRIEPQVTWGTLPDMVAGVTAHVPETASFGTADRAHVARKALDYMRLAERLPIQDIRLDKVFIGSCTNARIEDLRAAASVIRGRQVAPTIKLALVVPGSGLVKRQAESEGLDRVFIDAGFEWRDAGCSMCLGMNDDRLDPGERCASTSNRNFEGRQGAGSHTHLVSPAMAAAAAIAGHFVDVRELINSPEEAIA